MKSTQRILGVVICAFAVFGCLAVRAGADRERTREAIPSQRELVPFEGTELPYAGFGRVTILDNGTLLIRAGGSPERDSGEDGENLPFETIAYQLDTSDLSIVFHRKDVFLDRAGKQITDRGLTARQVRTMSFVSASALDRRAAREAVLSSSGELRLRFDEVTRRLEIASKDTERTGRVLRLAATIRLSSERTDRDATSKAVPQALQATRDENAIVATVPQHENASTCSTVCARGSCDVTFQGVCAAYCDDGGPVCECTSSNIQ